MVKRNELRPGTGSTKCTIFAGTEDSVSHSLVSDDIFAHKLSFHFGTLTGTKMKGQFVCKYIITHKCQMMSIYPSLHKIINSLELLIPSYILKDPFKYQSSSMVRLRLHDIASSSKSSKFLYQYNAQTKHNSSPIILCRKPSWSG